MAVAIRYIKYSGDYENVFEWGKKIKEIARHKGTLKYLKKKVDIPTEDASDKDGDKVNIYEYKSKAWDLIIISLTEISFGLVKQYDKNAHYAWKALIHRYEVSNENQDTLNEVTNRWNNCSIKDTSQDTDIWSNE